MHRTPPPDQPTGIVTSQPSVAGMVAFTAIVVALLYAVADRLIEDVLEIDSAWGQVGEIVIMSLLTSVMLWVGVLRPLHRQSIAQEAAAATGRVEQAENTAQQMFESELHRALEMAPNEEMAYSSTAKALRVGLNGLDAELLLADSSDAHLKRALAAREDGPHCQVVSPHDCPAIRRSQSLVFPSSGALDACPHLENRPDGACSAVCIPLSVGGRSIGVLHAVGVDRIPPTKPQIARLEAIASHGGARIGMLRVMSTTTLQAATDPLTGLLNRRAFENRAHALVQRGRQFALAMGDLDHFKRLNDTFGHEAGDRALRLFARVLRTSMRAEDLISRYGGEEFVIVFPGLSTEQAAGALTRMQEALLVAFAESSVPQFSVSYGVTDSDQALALDELCRIADTALFRAKRNGRNCVVVDNGSLMSTSDLLVRAEVDDPDHTRGFSHTNL